jgi:hypothetical protein
MIFEVPNNIFERRGFRKAQNLGGILGSEARLALGQEVRGNVAPARQTASVPVRSSRREVQGHGWFHPCSSCPRSRVRLRCPIALDERVDVCWTEGLSKPITSRRPDRLDDVADLRETSPGGARESGEQSPRKPNGLSHGIFERLIVEASSQAQNHLSVLADRHSERSRGVFDCTGDGQCDDFGSG